MEITCLDLEGVLIPEIWINVAKKTGIDALKITTRDEPDYDILMRKRLAILDDNGLKLPDIDAVIGDMKPLEGALSFLDALRARGPVIILSDTFYEFAMPLMAQLNWPTLFCHKLATDETGRITDYRLRMADHKTRAIQSFNNLNFKTMAAGDSYNDTGMLAAADHGFFLNAPQSIIGEFPQFSAFDDYNSLLEAFDEARNKA